MNHEDFFKYLIQEKITDLLDTIHFKYPKLFTQEIKKQEIQSITSLIKFVTLDNSNYTTKIETKRKKYILKKHKTPKKIKQYPILERCQARTWGPINKNGDKITYGYQCNKKKHQGSPYCFIHQKKLTHGNYFEEPSQVMKTHFKKNNKQ